MVPPLFSPAAVPQMPPRPLYVSPFVRLNLRRNPFGEPAPEEVGELVVADVESMAGWLSAPRRALQLIGDCGRGKTARLHALRRWWPDVPYVYLAEGAPVPPLPETPRLFLDEAQRLPRRRRRELFRRVESIALATHQDYRRELERAGLEVQTIEVGGADARLLLAVFARRVEWARLGPGRVPSVTARAVEELIGRYGDDVRSMLDELYEVYQALEMNRDIQSVEGDPDGEV